jgi:hypothetical protein
MNIGILSKGSGNYSTKSLKKKQRTEATMLELLTTQSAM